MVHLARNVPGIRIEDGGAFDLKGMDAPVPVLRVSSEDGSAAPAHADGGASAGDLPPELDSSIPLIGRDREARWLRWWWRRTRRGHGGLVTVEGPPGIGRTRLVADVAALAWADGATVRAVKGFGEQCSVE